MKARVVQVLKLLPLLFLVTCAQKSGEGLPVIGDLSCTKTTTIHVVVRGVESTEGQMLLSLYASPEGFPGDPEKAVRTMEASVDGEQMSFTFPPLRSGRYAVSVFHDENANYELETDFLGRPKEGYGFSRNARGRFGPPGFDSAAFDATSDSVTVEIDLRYR